MLDLLRRWHLKDIDEKNHGLFNQGPWQVTILRILSRCLAFSRNWVGNHYYMAKWTLIYKGSKQALDSIKQCISYMFCAPYGASKCLQMGTLYSNISPRKKALHQGSSCKGCTNYNIKKCIVFNGNTSSEVRSNGFSSWLSSSLRLCVTWRVVIKITSRLLQSHISGSSFPGLWVV